MREVKVEAVTFGLNHPRYIPSCIMPPEVWVGLDRQEGGLDEDEEEDQHVLEALKPIVREASIMKYETHHQVSDFDNFIKQQRKCKTS